MLNLKGIQLIRKRVLNSNILKLLQMKWCNDIPEEEGIYIVQTKSIVLKIIRTMDAKLSFDLKGNPKWSFSNQEFYRYLKEN